MDAVLTRSRVRPVERVRGISWDSLYQSRENDIDLCAPIVDLIRIVGEMSFHWTREKSTRGISLGMRRACIGIRMYIHRRLLHLEFRVSIDAISLATSRIYSRSFTTFSEKPNDKTKYIKIVSIFNPKLDLTRTRALLCTEFFWRISIICSRI